MEVRIRTIESDVTGTVGWVDAAKIDALVEFCERTHVYDGDNELEPAVASVQIVLEDGKAFCEILLP